MKYWLITVNEEFLSFYKCFPPFNAVAEFSHKDMEENDQVFFYRLKGKKFKSKDKDSGIIARGKIIFKGSSKRIEKKYSHTLDNKIWKNRSLEGKEFNISIIELDKSNFKYNSELAIISIDDIVKKEMIGSNIVKKGIPIGISPILLTLGDYEKLNEAWEKNTEEKNSDEPNIKRQKKESCDDPNSNKILSLPFIENKVQIEGLQHQAIPGDGHCLFHAVGLYVNDSQDWLRRFTAMYIEINQENLKDFMALLNGKSVEDYIADIRDGNEWGSHIEIEALMQVFDRPILVIEFNGKITNPDDINRFKGEPIFVYYNGYNHYDALLLSEQYSGRTILDNLLKNRQHNDFSKNLNNNQIQPKKINFAEKTNEIRKLVEKLKMNKQENKNAIIDIINQLDELEKELKEKRNPTKIGDKGENYVFEHILRKQYEKRFSKIGPIKNEKVIPYYNIKNPTNEEKKRANFKSNFKSKKIEWRKETSDFQVTTFFENSESKIKYKEVKTTEREGNFMFSTSQKQFSNLQNNTDVDYYLFDNNSKVCTKLKLPKLKFYEDNKIRLEAEKAKLIIGHETKYLDKKPGFILNNAVFKKC